MRTVLPVAFGLALAALLLCLPRPAEAGGVVGSGPGSCTEAAFDAKWPGGGTVTFDCGVSPATIQLTSRKTITLPTTINGAGLITLDGGSGAGNFSGIFYVNPGANLTLTQLTLAHCTPFSDGGAIYNSGHLTLDSTTLANNDASGHRGGALYNAGDATVTNSFFSQNQSKLGQGGAIYNIGLMTITNTSLVGNTGGSGGAIANPSGSLVIAGSDFSRNIASVVGGAIYNQAIVALSNTSFDNNTGTSGGAIENLDRLDLSGGVFYSNTATVNNGGAIDSTNAAAITSTTFLSNTAVKGGGGLHLFGSLTVLSSTLQGNQANNGLGGAIYNQGSLVLNADTLSGNTAGPTGLGNAVETTLAATLFVTNSTFSGNYGGTSLLGPYGGGLAAFGPVTVTNSTLTGNDVGGLAAYGAFSITVQNTLLAGNNDFNCIGPIRSLGHNLDGGNTCQLRAAGDLTNTNPLLGPLAANGGPTLTHALLAGSPAINHGDNLGCPGTDQRGYSRVGECDIGAFEYVFRLFAPLIRK